MDFSAFVTFDYVIIFIVAMCTLMAFVKGFVGTILFFAAWVASYYVAYIGTPALAPHMPDKLGSGAIAAAAAGTAIFIPSLIVFSLISNLLLAKVKVLRLGAVDRSLGVALGLGLGGTVAVLLLMLINLVNVMLGVDEEGKHHTPVWVKEAQTYPYLKAGNRFAMKFIPKTWSNGTIETLEEMQTEMEISEGEEAIPESLRNAETLNKVFRVLPSEDMVELRNKYHRSSQKQLSDKDKILLFYDMMNRYKEADLNGKITNKELFTKNELEDIDQFLYSDITELNALEPEAGYHQEQINEINRLIHTIELE